MPGIERAVIPGIAHHVTQRGNRRGDIFFEDEDRQCYLQLLLEYSTRHGLRILAYCLMTNHVHLVCMPEKEDEGMMATIRLHTRTGRPAWDERFVSALESRLGRRLLARSIGRPRKGKTKALRKG